MSSHQPAHGALRRALGAIRRGRALALGLLAPGALTLALAGAGAAPSQASAADAPRLIATYRVNTVTCVPGPSNTVRARVGLWMRVVNYDGIADWADHMEAKVRLEPTTAGTNWTREWTSYKTPYLTQNRKHTLNRSLLSDNLSGTAEWRVHVKLIWHRPAPIRNVTKNVYLQFDASCAQATGGGTPPVTGRNGR